MSVACEAMVSCGVLYMSPASHALFFFSLRHGVYFIILCVFFFFLSLFFFFFGGFFGFQLHLFLTEVVIS